MSEEMIVGNPLDAMNKIQPSIKDYFIILTHNYSKDKELIDYPKNCVFRIIRVKKSFESFVGSKNAS
ncbi:hypothetical protein [Niallia sp. 03133]|uniref:hypothetical protein n=1 Tax=Niallia sp. 03133 TaxID=3458060 RepID=UPI004044ED9D